MYNINHAIKVLGDFGFTDKETQIYLDLLKNGTGSSYSIAKNTGLKHPTVYILLKNMVEKGFINEVPEKKKPLYSAKKPETIRKMFSNRLSEFEKFVPVLSDLIDSRTEREDVFYYRGEKGAIDLLDSEEVKGKEKEIYSFYGTAQYLSLEYSDAISNYFNRLKKAGVSSIAIAPESETLKEWRALDEVQNRNVKVIGLSKYYSNMYIEISNTGVLIFNLKDPAAIKVTNQETIQFFKQIFKMIWEKY